jgi:(p)ppGpp synthase/HD superfamily hydrolase
MGLSEAVLAAGIAEKFHAGQLYGKEPYIYHLRAVVQSLETEYDERLVIIGWLHDIIEDTDCTEELLRALFDKDIVDAVLALSKRKGEPYEDYIARVKANPLALKVKMHDSKCNMEESLKRGDMKRVRKYANQILLLAS